MATKPLVVIVGPTASGKTALAIEVAKQYDGEVICADSRTIYKGMDIGTAKPTKSEQTEIPHWGLDLAEPGERFTAADFKEYADAKIRDIRRRGKLPIIVGGTGLYVDSVVYDFEFKNDYDKAMREQLENMTIDELLIYCKSNNIKPPENERNKRYIIRAIERHGENNSFEYNHNTNAIVVGIATKMSTLRARIAARAEHIFENGVVEEATMLGKKYGWSSEAMTGNIYRLLSEYSGNSDELKLIKDDSITTDYQLAKRQMTWFRRNPNILWSCADEAINVVQRYLAD